jgi:putative addiction module killer protein
MPGLPDFLQQRVWRLGNICVTISAVIDVREYVAEDGSSPYKKWFDSLNVQAAAKVAVAATRIAQGNFSNAKSVGGGLQEYRIDFEPGYRIYFGRDGDRLIIFAGWRNQKTPTR